MHPRNSFDELPQIAGTLAERLVDVRELGKGCLGIVKLSIDPLTGDQYAKKIIPKRKSGDAQKVRAEVQAMETVNHKNIVRLYDFGETVSEYFLIMEFAEGGDVLQLIKRKKRVPENESRSVFLQIVSALQHSHSRRIVHRDVKAENIMLDRDGNVKIGDWGFATEWAPGKVIKTFCGSVHYSAPEICMGRHYVGPEVDVWSTGVLLFMLVTGCFPFSGRTEREVFERIKAGRVKFPTGCSELVKDLIRRMLTVDPSRRATFAEVERHPWCRDEPLLATRTSSMNIFNSFKSSAEKIPTFKSTLRSSGIRTSSEKVKNNLKASGDKIPWDKTQVPAPTATEQAPAAPNSSVAQQAAATPAVAAVVTSPPPPPAANNKIQQLKSNPQLPQPATDIPCLQSTPALKDVTGMSAAPPPPPPPPPAPVAALPPQSTCPSHFVPSSEEIALKRSINNLSNVIKPSNYNPNSNTSTNSQNAANNNGTANPKLSNSPAMFRKISISEISLRRSALKGASDKHPIPDPSSVATCSPNFRRRSGVPPPDPKASADAETKEDHSLLRKVMDRFKSLRTPNVSEEGVSSRS